MHFAKIKSSIIRFLPHASRYWTVRAKLTFLYLCIFGSTLIIFCSSLYKSFVANQQNSFDIALFNYAVDIAQGIRIDPFGHFVMGADLLSTGGKIFPFSPGNVYIQVLTLDGIEVGRSRNLGKTHLPLAQNDWQLVFQNRGIFRTLSANELQTRESSAGPLPQKQATREGSFRLLTTLSPGQIEENFILQVAVSQAPLLQVTQNLKEFLWMGIPLALILSTLGGYYLSRKALDPVRKIIEKANNLSPDHLSDRVPVSPARDELQSLALTLNALLDRLQRAFESQERFIADASHELKTPLAILRGEFEVFLNRERNPEEVRSLIVSGVQELGHLSRIVEDLLILARVDAGSSVLAKSLTRLDEVVLDVITQLESMSRQKEVKIRMNLSGDLFVVQGDTDLLRVLIKNLIENAIKHSPAKQVVEIRLRSSQEWLDLEVTDHGCGIAPLVLPRIFERFYRGPERPETSQKETQGAGLGLAIAKKIAELHNGEIKVSSIPDQETTFKVKMRRSSAIDTTARLN